MYVSIDLNNVIQLFQQIIENKIRLEVILIHPSIYIYSNYIYSLGSTDCKYLKCTDWCLFMQEQNNL